MDHLSFANIEYAAIKRPAGFAKLPERPVVPLSLARFRQQMSEGSPESRQWAIRYLFDHRAKSISSYKFDCTRRGSAEVPGLFFSPRLRLSTSGSATRCDLGRHIRPETHVRPCKHIFGKNSRVKFIDPFCPGSHIEEVKQALFPHCD